MACFSLLVTAYVVGMAIYMVIETRNAVDAVRQLIHTMRRLRAVYRVLKLGVHLEAKVNHKINAVWYEREYGKPSNLPGDSALNTEAPSDDVKPKEETPCDSVVQS